MNKIENIRQEIERLKKILEESTYYLDNSQQALGYSFALDDFKEFIDSLPEETSCIYDTNELTPTPSVNIEDVARVQFASHAHVFDRKRKAVFDWEQFKEVVGIFYGFGKKNSLPDEKPSEDLEEAAEDYAYSGIPDEMKPYVKPVGDEVIKNFIAGAEWKANQLLKGSPLPEDTILFQKGVEEGRRLEKDDLALTWDDIKSIVQIADKMLDDPKARVEFQNHNEEYYYKRVLDEYNKLHQTEEE